MAPTPRPHTHECQLRWADMDLLGHVNNVRYLDYATSARRAALSGLPSADAPVRSHRIDFVAPLVFRRTPVLVDTWVTAIDDDRVALAHEVYDAPADEGGERTVHLRVSTELDHRADAPERETLEPLRGEDHSWRPLTHEARPARSATPMWVRPSDLDATRHVRDGVLLEYLQEARIRYFMDLHSRGQVWSQHVVARTDLRIARSMSDRSSPYAVHSWVGHLGTSSFTVCAEIRDGETVLAEADVVMVTFDSQTQRPAPMAPSQRERLEQELR